MRTKGSKNKGKIDDSKPLSSDWLNPSTEAPEETDTIASRLSMPLNVDGQVEWDRMRSSTKEQLKAILANPETAKVLGVDSPAPAQVEVFDPEWTGALYDAIGKLEAFLAGKLYKISPDITERAFTYNDEEKKKLAGPTAKVINKYAVTWMVQFKDEIALAFLFVTITAVKLQMATILQNMRGASAPSFTPPQPPEPKATDISAENLERATGQADA